MSDPQHPINYRPPDVGPPALAMRPREHVLMALFFALFMLLPLVSGYLALTSRLPPWRNSAERRQDHVQELLNRGALNGKTLAELESPFGPAVRRGDGQVEWGLGEERNPGGLFDYRVYLYGQIDQDGRVSGLLVGKRD